MNKIFQHPCGIGRVFFQFVSFINRKKFFKILALSFLIPISGDFVVEHGSSITGLTLLYAARGNTSCRESGQGPVIEWNTKIRLSWDDFQASSTSTDGFAVATATSRFSYQTRLTGDKLQTNVFVRFYCHESWKNPRLDIPEVLGHEQLHFDICELYGRLFYRAIRKQRDSHLLNEKVIWKLYRRFQDEFDQYQDLYDEETGHSTDGEMQQKWRQKTDMELAELVDFSDYREY